MPLPFLRVLLVLGLSLCLNFMQAFREQFKTTPHTWEEPKGGEIALNVSLKEKMLGQGFQPKVQSWNLKD